MTPKKDHSHFMNEALKEAQKSLELNEVPVGCVMVLNEKVIGRSHNQTELLKDATAHAEMLAITSTSADLGSKYLRECTLYVTLEPCAMCAGAIFWSKVGTLVFGAKDLEKGFETIAPNLLKKPTKIVGPFMELACSQLLHLFFEQKRMR